MKFKKITLFFTSIVVGLGALLSISGCSSKPKVSPNVLCLQFNDFLEETMEDGTHEQMIDTWFSLDSKTKNIDLKSLKDINGTIKVALIEGTAPFTFLANNQYSGLMVDLVARFAKRYQYGVKFEGYSGLGAVISAVNSGLADIGAAPVTITKEREQAVLFSNCFYEDKMGILLRKEDATKITKLEDLNNKVVGVEAGSMFPKLLEDFTTGTTFLEFNSVPDLCLALKNKTVDCGVSDESTMKYAALEETSLTTIPMDVVDNPLGVIFRKTTYSTFEELNGKTIGIFQESIMKDTLDTLIESPVYKVYDDNDAYGVKRDLDNGVLDACCGYLDQSRYLDTLLNGYSMIAKTIYSIKNTMVFPNNLEGKELLAACNTFIKNNESTHLFNKIKRKWTNKMDTDFREIPNYKTLPQINGALKVGIEAEFIPYVIKENNAYTGLYIDYLSVLAQECGFSLEFVNLQNNLDHADIFSDGKTNLYVDIGGMVLDADNYVRSEIFGECKVNLLVRDTYSVKVNFFESVAMNFKKTFIVEDRYKIFLNGVTTTLLISVASILFGLILGFLFFVLIRNTPKVSNIVYKIIDFIISGTPAVVFLMICYYIIFKGSNLSGTFVSIIAFSLIFMCSTVAFLKTGFDSIDKGQAEAAFTLGYSKPRTFFKILLPQASKTFLPILKGDIISHIKGTAIVGYIAIVDLTKASELVRSRTFDAFFSLIVATILYFALEYLFIFLIKLIPVDPKKRKSLPVLKGVEAHD